ncbi:fumarylacetoacetate hydrolase family protein [Caldimonas brevitalea]|uniref:5-carboxymethyl-2-hydroxymuconate isomerase n=1 Tax=Caldimonas brevitalea TaxID=413882 RepID=A0A0G3BSS9_9BURK|nr:fumarylacetoacetate hydrolase family protein [Caldimonas brevitalea]AKJ29600.1 5-carboxymethyl-2-hydroxymuconate isomerase [Caldimonas brevitalea]
MNDVIPAPEVPRVPIAGGAGQFPVRRIYCVGRNYVEHAIEMGHSGREAPFFFLKPADVVLPVGEGDVGQMPYPTLTKNLHHELELVVAIGKGGRNIPSGQALEHVWGYAVGLDMTRRDLQNEMKQQGRPWSIGKGFEASAPIGPISPAGVVPGIHDAEIVLTVNGQTRQSSRTSKLIWNVSEVIEHLSAAWTLAPGDLIYTGTPEGVGAVVSGDLLQGRIEGLRPLNVAISA